MPLRSVTGIKVHIVVQIGELPLETGGIGEYADFVLVEMRHPADDFQHHLPSGRLSDTPMHDRRGLQSDDPNRSDGRFHLVDGRELRQYPGHELQIGQRAVALRPSETWRDANPHSAEMLPDGNSLRTAERRKVRPTVPLR